MAAVVPPEPPLPPEPTVAPPPTPSRPPLPLVLAEELLAEELELTPPPTPVAAPPPAPVVLIFPPPPEVVELLLPLVAAVTLDELPLLDDASPLDADVAVPLVEDALVVRPLLAEPTVFAVLLPPPPAPACESVPEHPARNATARIEPHRSPSLPDE